jgi:hypothetical protein
MKGITIDSLNNGIFSFVLFSSQPGMLMGRETAYTIIILSKLFMG